MNNLISFKVFKRWRMIANPFSKIDCTIPECMKKALLIFVTVNAGVAVASNFPRSRTLIDADWRFKLESQIVLPSGPSTALITDWTIRESMTGEADLPAVLATLSEPTGWTPAKTNEDLSPQHKGRYLWYRANLSALAPKPGQDGEVAVSFPCPGPRADSRLVIYINGHRITDRTGDGKAPTANAEIMDANGLFAYQLVESKGVPTYIEARLTKWWNAQGPNELLVVVRPGDYMTGPVIFNVGRPAEAAAAFDAAAWRRVNLPHDYVVEGTFDEKYSNLWGSLPTPRAWYRKQVNIPASLRGRRLSVEFDGVYRDSEIWFNGHYLGNHPSGYTSFTLDLTPFVKFGQENTLAVRTDPRVHEGWWYEGGGIYRHVWLTATEPLHVAHWGTYITSEVANVTSESPSAEVTIRTRVVNETTDDQTCELATSVIDPSGTEVAVVRSKTAVKSGEEVEVTQLAKLATAKLWSCESPHMYRAVTRVVRGSQTLDEYATPFGIRTIRFDVDRGFFLNEKPVAMNGTCNHLDFAGVGIAMPDNLQIWRIAKLKEMGSNAWRCSHNPPSNEFLNACDRMGILVIDENRHLVTDNGRKNQNPDLIVANFDELHSMLLRDRNHPSIVLWSLANEEPHIPTTTKSYKILKEEALKFDKTRPFTGSIIGAKGDSYEAEADVIGLNYAQGERFDDLRKKFPDKPIIAEESGGARSDRGIYENDPPGDPARNPEKIPPVHVDNYNRDNIAYWKPAAQRPWVGGYFYWTGFDYKGEPSPSRWPAIMCHFGIFDLCGFPKDSYYYYKARWNLQKPLVHVFPHWNWPGSEGKPIRVVVVGNTAQVELLLNGQSLGIKPVVSEDWVEWRVPYAPGKLEVRGITDGKVLATKVVETTGEPAAIKLRTDMPKLRANGQDIAVAEVSIVDAAGRVVPTASNEVTFTLEGPGEIAGVGNGDPACHEPDVASKRSAFNGHCASMIRASKQMGIVKLVASSPNLKSATLEIKIDKYHK
jgi:beta-galactosidase